MNNELKYLFNVESICSMIRLLPKTIGMDTNIVFERDGKQYSIVKTNKCIALSCSDNRRLVINVSDGKMKNNYGYKDYIMVTCNYNISETANINFYKLLENCKFEDLEELEAYRLSKSDGVKFVSSFNCRANQFTHFRYDGIDDLTVNGNVVEYKDYIISLKDNKITSKKKIIPTKEELENFNIEDLKLRIVDSVTKDLNVEPYIKEHLLANIDEEKIIKDNEELKNLYDKLPSIKDAVNFRKVLLFGNIYKYVFNNEEMAMFDDVLINEISKKLPKTDEDMIAEEVEEAIRNIYQGTKDFVNDARDMVTETFDDVKIAVNDTLDDVKELIKKKLGL
jgi:hypothetical protein